MKNRAKSIVRGALWAACLLGPATAAAQEAEQQTSRFSAEALGWGVASTLVYGALGIVLVIIGYKVFSWMLPFDVKKELEEDHNTSVGILLAALVLGICLVVAATIHS